MIVSLQLGRRKVDVEPVFSITSPSLDTMSMIHLPLLSVLDSPPLETFRVTVSGHYQFPLHIVNDVLQVIY